MTEEDPEARWKQPGFGPDPGAQPTDSDSDTEEEPSTQVETPSAEKVPLTFMIFLAMLSREWRHVPNLVTEARLVGAALLPFAMLMVVHTTIPEDQLWAFFQGNNVFLELWGLITYAGFLTAWLFVVTALTDMLDGFLAKKIFGTTDLGAILDPFVDKLLMLVSVLVALVATVILGLWVVFAALLILAVFLIVRERDVFRLKKAEAAARVGDKVASARQSGRVSMVVFCAAMTVALMPVVGPWSSGIKSVLIATTIVFSRRSWNDYRLEYGQYLK